ncbi:DNA alkylation repair protein [Sporosarcina ureilytica]|uniref:DNA alkylation repair protein n=1 Tax=Sporosarcina ureilytica TaxID=298596 RepID=A0A1D8JGY7_9BACL|nr:DNA alkylation repair protein [Sporosarcina ureilytica]AOV07977.1 DNA alkylation repair protein [Sporosarcina ureilytica]
MNLHNIFTDLEKNTDIEKAKQMEKYMKNNFRFLGIQTPLRKEITKSYFSEAKKVKNIDWEFIDTCWKKSYREAQYVAIDYLKMMNKFLEIEDVDKIKLLLVNKSWWDSVDGLHRIIGDLALKHPALDQMMIEWSKDENIWLRRIAINHQMFRKEKMKEELLEKILINNFESEEFFINKAIGWTLRDYSKTNPTWVIQFIDKHREKLSPLSIREGSKYISI